MKKNNRKFFDRVITWLEMRNWQVVIGPFLLIVSMQIFEVFYKVAHPGNGFHFVELVVYLIILLFLGVLFNALKKSKEEQSRYMQILEFKHTTSMELTEIEDWDMLLPKLVKVPGKIVNVEACRLLLYNPISGKQETVAEWTEPGVKTVDFSCQNHQDFIDPNETQLFHDYCPPVLTKIDRMPKQLEYCLPIIYTNRLLASFQLRLKPGEVLSEEQKKLFESIGPEIALALKANQEQKRLFELRQTQLALEERHSISTYLHDTLSPNLAYLGLKLSQFISGQEQSSMEQGVQELKRMKEAVNQSYDIVRKMIETIHPVTTPCLVNLLDKKIQEVSKRTHVNITLEKRGKELAILPETQQAVFYVFQEALNNVEKHAHAQTAKVLVDWREDELAVHIKDDGIGFNMQPIDVSKHFGFEIMQERIKKVKGRVEIRSSINSGTEVNIVVPVAIISKSTREGLNN